MVTILVKSELCLSPIAKIEKEEKKQLEFMWYVVKDNALQLDLTSIAWLKFIN